MNHSFAEVPQAFPMVGLGTVDCESGSPVVLLFDSFCQGSFAGVRSDAMGVRQMLYRADPYQIDLQLEADREHNRLIVTGQLLDISRPEMACRDVPVMLSNLHGNAVNTPTNQFGEFRAELENSGDLELSFLGHTGARIAILLRGAVAHSAGA